MNLLDEETSTTKHGGKKTIPEYSMILYCHGCEREFRCYRCRENMFCLLNKSNIFNKWQQKDHNIIRHKRREAKKRKRNPRTQNPELLWSRREGIEIPALYWSTISWCFSPMTFGLHGETSNCACDVGVCSLPDLISLWEPVINKRNSSIVINKRKQENQNKISL